MGVGSPEDYVEITYKAGPGQRNDVTVTADDDCMGDCPRRWTFREKGTAIDTGAPIELVAVGPDCVNSDPFTVECIHLLDEYYESLEVHLDDGDDAALLLSACGKDFWVSDQKACQARVHGGAGDDRIDGTSAYKHYPAHADRAPVTQVSGESGNDTLIGHFVDGGDGNDTLTGSFDNDHLDGDGGDDVVIGEGGNDVLVGQGGNDRLTGGDGFDRLLGDGGNDTISAGGGNDVAAGGYGRDQVYLGYGDDRAFMRDGWRDYVGGGPGSDRARTDTYDTRANMEGTF